VAAVGERQSGGRDPLEVVEHVEVVEEEERGKGKKTGWSWLWLDQVG
jgi:hypothetical protein